LIFVVPESPSGTKNPALEERKRTGLFSLSKIFTVAVEGEIRTAELVGLLNVRLKVSFPFSNRLSSRMGMEMNFVNSPGAKVSVPLVAV
jgi:hypothetical protein